MANSPGPSSSKSVNPNNQTNSADDVAGNKKKRARRKPRHRDKKKEGKHSPESNDLISFLPTFVITPVKQPRCVIYKQRDKSQGPINLKVLTSSVVQKLSKLSINGICAPKKTSPDKKLSDKTVPKKKKEKKKKDVLLFGQYLTQAEVDVGLECGELIKGFVRINHKNPKEAYVGNEDVSKYDHVISSVLDRNRAMDGDEVVLRLKAAENDGKLMEVVFITRQIHPRSGVGFLSPIEKNKEFALFTPRDRRIPKMKIPKISWPSGFQATPDLYHNILFTAKITDWREVKYALGVITENLGLSGDLKVESLAILREFCLDPTPYPDDIKEFLPKSANIPLEEIESREDLRKECIFTIDPETARDLDDAVSCKELANGNYEVGVHISDASFYLKENTRLDEMVKKKATTIYMVDSVYHMLPVELCLFCSLLPGQDKLAFSVLWEMTPTGDVVSHRITRTVINSCVQLAYEHAQMMIDHPERRFASGELPDIHNGFTSDDLSKTVNGLQRIAVCLRERRRVNGSLKIDQVKIAFTLDPATGDPTQFRVYENKPSHRLIEEFMLLANMTVAKWIYRAYPDLAFLRLHEPPKMTMMMDLQRNLDSIGFHVDISSSGGIQSSMDKYVGHDFTGKCRMMVLNHLLAKPMRRARYFCAGALEEGITFNHFALSIPIYTHFTSPIRRYADIVVHRLLAASLNYADKPSWTPEEVSLIAETCNRQKYHAKRAGEGSSDLFLVHYVERNQPVVQDAVVVDTKERSIDVIVINTGSVIRIYVNNFGEGVTWKAEEIKIQRDPRSTIDNGKKLWKMYVKFPRTQTEEAACMVLEIFTLVRIELSRKPKSNSLEAKLLRPIREVNLLG